jgi:hypothetical protein
MTNPKDSQDVRKQEQNLAQKNRWLAQIAAQRREVQEQNAKFTLEVKIRQQEEKIRQQEETIRQQEERMDVVLTDMRMFSSELEKHQQTATDTAKKTQEVQKAEEDRVLYHIVHTALAKSRKRSAILTRVIENLQR